MNSLRIMGPKQIKAEHLVAMAVHMEWLATVLSPSNIFTLFMKYFISSIANAKYKSQEMLCAFPAGVVDCQCPCYTAFSLERLSVCSQDTLLLIPPSSDSSISTKKRRRKRNLDLFTLADRNHEQKRQFDLLMWEIRFPSEIYPMHSRIQGKNGPKKKKKEEEIIISYRIVASSRNRNA